MGTLIVRRLAALIPLLFVMSFAIFCLSLGLRPEAAAETRAGGQEATTEAINNAIKALRLDDPFLVRYGRWLGHAATFDLGRSYVKLQTIDTPKGQTLVGVSVTESIKRVLPKTASIIFLATVLAVVIGVGVGILGGTRPGSLGDRISAVFSTIGLAVPNFWIAMMLVWLFAVTLNWLPATGYVSVGKGGIAEWLEHLIMPAFALCLGPAAIIARQMRSSLIDVMGSTYIRTAWAKGASTPRVVYRHALKNAASAPLTVFGVILTSLLGGTVIIETLFGIDGTGLLIVNAVRSSDVPMLQGIVLMFVVATMVINLVIDLLYGYLNPKVRIT